MKKHGAIPLVFAPLVFATIMIGFTAAIPYAAAQSGGTTGPAGATGATGAAASDSGVSGAIEQKALLSQAQRAALYRAVSLDKTKTAQKSFSPVIGADVPPMIELYELPDNTLADVPAAKLYKYTLVQDEVVVVDPTKMRVIDVIGPKTQQ
jgi:hypothetical protein